MTEVNFTMSDATFGVVMIIGFSVFILGLWLGITVEQMRQEQENISNLDCNSLKKYILEDHFYERPTIQFLQNCVSEDYKGNIIGKPHESDMP